MKRRLALIGFLLFSLPASGGIRLPHLFSDGAVFQRDRPVPVWGWAEPGKKVVVEFAGQSKSAKTGGDGRWSVRLDPMPANASGTDLSVREDGGEPVRVADILVGEVWLASGQSNMEWPISRSRQEDQAAAATGDVPELRIFNVPNKLSPHPLGDVDSKWKHATPESVRSFSAVAYFFGRELREKLDVPIGLISSEWGGSRIEPWIPETGFADVLELEQTHRYRKPRIPGTKAYEKAARRHLSATRAWLDEAHKALEHHQAPPAQPAAPPMLRIGHNAELGLYQAMIHPLKPYALRGFIWYQGESNREDGISYRWKMEALIKGWRKVFEAPDAPFLYVQLAPFDYGDESPLLPRLWAAQTDTLEIPHTGMAVTNDIGNLKDIHPGDKSTVGHRLALLALADTYGRKDVVKSGPLFRSFEPKDGSIAVRFDHADGLRTRDGKDPDWFEIAGTNEEFHPARAQIEDGRVILTSDKVSKPAQARFAWSQTATPNLVNGAGLPASAFHTHWPHDPELGRNVALGKRYTSSDPNRNHWNSGLTDGRWDGASGQCFATGNSPQFPKHATIDLNCTRDIHAVRLGTPAFGSTKTVAVSVSANGEAFEEVGRHDFKAGTEEKTTIRFDSRPARHVRITFLDQHPKQDRYGREHGFIREVEVYKAR